MRFGTVTIAGHTLSAADNDYTMQLVTGDGTTAQQLSAQGAVILDTTVTSELEAEGTARDLIRLIQQSRKEADLHVSDRIELVIHAPENLTDAIKTHKAFIQSETLAEDLSLGDPATCDFQTEQSLNDIAVGIGFSRKKAAAA